MPGDGKANQLAYQLSGEVIDNVQYPKTSAIAQLVCHKVHRPALVRGRWDLHGKTGALELLAFLGSDLKTLLTIEAERVNLKWTVCFKLIVNFLEPPEALGS
jgi:hypothetical protein